MRLLSFSADGAPGRRAGIQTSAGIVEVATLLGLVGASARTAATVRQLLNELAPEALRHLAQEAESRMEEVQDCGGLHPPDAVRLGPPVPDPEKIICLGLNYRDHAEEAGLQPPAAPMFFAKYPNSLIGPNDPIVVPAVAGEQVDYEAEMAVVLGREAARVDPARAMSYVAGVMAFNDISARDLQLANPLWTGGKAIDTFGPCGPALVTLDEVGDIMDLSLRARVNGTVVQDGTTADMIFGVGETIAFLSRIMTLRPGDIIATGTPAGVGNSRTPKLFLAPGDIVEVELGGVGSLRNSVAAGT